MVRGFASHAGNHQNVGVITPPVIWYVNSVRERAPARAGPGPPKSPCAADWMV